MSLTIKFVPLVLVLVIVKLLTVLCDRSSAASDVTSWAFVLYAYKAGNTSKIGAVDPQRQITANAYSDS